MKMQKILLHISIAILCTSIGTSIWLYRENILFPAEPVPFEPEQILLKSSTLLEPEQMREDFIYIVEVIESVHPDPYNLIGEEAWEKRKNELAECFANPLAAADYYFVLKSLVGAIGDAHTTVRFEETDQWLPLTFRWVKEGLVIERDHDQFKKGDLIVAIGGKCPLELLDILSEVVSAENIYRVEEKSLTVLRRKPIYEHLELLDDDTITFLIERDNIEMSLKSRFDHKSSLEQVHEAILSDRHGWNIDRANNLALFYLNVCIDDELFQKAVADFFTAVRSAETGTVIIDLRENIGGESRVIDALMRQLPLASYQTYGTMIRYSKLAAERAGLRRTRGTRIVQPSTRMVKAVEEPFEGNLFILTGKKTFSAGNGIAVIFHDNNLGLIIGEPTGNAPSSFGDVISFQLPHSGFILGVSYKYFTRPEPANDPADALYPRVTIEQTRQNVITGTDPVIEHIRKKAAWGEP